MNFHRVPSLYCGLVILIDDLATCFYVYVQAAEACTCNLNKTQIFIVGDLLVLQVTENF